MTPRAPAARRTPVLAALCALALAWPTSGTGAAQAAGEADAAPEIQGAIATTLEELGEDIRVYNDHVVTLANPFMEGRLPGTRGMEIAKDYCEYWFREAGLEPGFAGLTSDPEANPWRQPFPLAATPKLIEQHLSVADAPDGELVPTFVGGEDYNAMAIGASADVTAPVVFVGYSIDGGPDGYSSYADGDDLSGKIALMLRFEPMDAEGKSLWSERGPWSARASFANKLRAAAERNAAGVIIVNTPGADDPRVDTLSRLTGGGSGMREFPVMMLATTAGERLVDAIHPSGPSLRALREQADAGGGIVDLPLSLRMHADIERVSFMAENVGALLPGRGDLADDYIVIGGHLDHLGMGDFGSRSGAGKLHPGADDNASGSAAVLMLADKLNQAYAELPEGTPARSILFICFSAEESGLNGARHYANNPVAPLEQHSLMINFDMIGRIRDDRLSVSGTGTAEGLADWVAPFFEASPLEIVVPAGMSGASDHSAFYNKGVPVLFGIIADFHNDYHTPRDVSSLINREGGVKTVHLFRDIAFAAGTRTEPFDFTQVTAPAQRLGGNRAGNAAAGGGTPGDAVSMGQITVRFGISPGNYEEGSGGVLVGSVSAGTSASEAGILPEDVLMRWDGQKITDVMAWMGMLADHDPGDEVNVGVLRGTEEITLPVTLKAKDQAGR